MYAMLIVALLAACAVNVACLCSHPASQQPHPHAGWLEQLRSPSSHFAVR